MASARAGLPATPRRCRALEPPAPTPGPERGSADPPRVVSAGASVELAIAHVAALRLGLVVVPVNTAFGPDELGSVAAAAAPALAVLDDPGRLPGVPDTGPGVGLPDGSVPNLDVAAPDDTALLVFTSGT